jgi:hypothetical protein
VALAVTHAVPVRAALTAVGPAAAVLTARLVGASLATRFATLLVAAFAATRLLPPLLVASATLVATCVPPRLIARSTASAAVALAFALACPIAVPTTVTVAIVVAVARRSWRRSHGLGRTLVTEQPVPEAHENAVAWTVLRKYDRRGGDRRDGNRLGCRRWRRGARHHGSHRGHGR